MDGGLTPDGNGGNYWAVDVKLSFEWKSSDKEGKCKLEWHEFSNQRLGPPDPKNPKQQKLLPNKWWNQMVEQPTSPTFAKWNNLRVPTDCTEPKPDSVTINDTPQAFPNPTTMKVMLYLDFAIVLRSADGCDCDDPKDHDDYAGLLINVQKGKLIDKGPLKSGLTLGQLKTKTFPKGLPLNK